MARKQKNGMGYYSPETKPSACAKGVYPVMTMFREIFQLSQVRYEGHKFFSYWDGKAWSVVFETEQEVLAHIAAPATKKLPPFQELWWKEPV